VALSVASTVVLLRLLQERRLVETEREKITVGWLIVQDIGMVLVLVLLPGLAGMFHGAATAPDAAEIVRTITIMLGKFGIFVAVMLLVGKRLIPAILH
jgi:monovalent cation:H+ antiporter-2, CPA2 family